MGVCGVWVVQVPGSVIAQRDMYMMWRPRTMEEVTPESMAFLELIKPKPEVVVIGCGLTTQPLPKDVAAYIKSLGLLTEVLDSVRAPTFHTPYTTLHTPHSIHHTPYTTLHTPHTTYHTDGLLWLRSQRASTTFLWCYTPMLMAVWVAFAWATSLGALASLHACLATLHACLFICLSAALPSVCRSATPPATSTC